MSDKKQSTVEKALEFLKGGDKSKLEKHYKSVRKEIEEQISIRKRSIETLQDKLEEATEAADEAVLSVDLSKIQTSDDRTRYTPKFIQQLSASLDVIDSINTQITETEQEIGKLELMLHSL